ncbi:MAG: dihydrodipicolinate synthase family protein [Candidatus Methylacidiphilales bacterium]|nr:dihydrodipicolinate synthase family protein [Candidatus Methylacidiphilales bacterium]
MNATAQQLPANLEVISKTTIAPGVWPVMLTPFTPAGAVDYPALDRLIDWYINARVAGLFAVCLSSEMYYLDNDERIKLARHVVSRAADRVPVVATGTFGGSIAEQAAMVWRMAETGVAGVVVISNQLAAAHESDAVWQQRAEELIRATGDIPLGLYECPLPYKRLLSAEMLKWAAQTGRFVFHKDTCCEMKSILAKLGAVRGTGFRWFNANTATLLESLLAGADGYSGIGANVMPALYSWLCRNYRTQPETAVRLQRFLSIADAVVRHKYPACAKHALVFSGLISSSHCRLGNPDFTEEDLIIVRDLQASIVELEAELSL